VLNRFSPRSVEIDEEAINKALTMPVKWRVPSDYPAVRRAQNTASPIALEGSAISQVIRQMANSAPGYSPAVEAKKKKFSIFGLT
jgi:pilus assembly protein CpaE